MRLRVNPVDRVVSGLCAQLSPESVQLDDRSRPIVGDGERAPDLIGHARRAAQACTTLALPLESDWE
jgi:ferredoxin